MFSQKKEGLGTSQFCLAVRPKIVTIGHLNQVRVLSGSSQRLAERPGQVHYAQAVLKPAKCLHKVKTIGFEFQYFDLQKCFFIAKERLSPFCWTWCGCQLGKPHGRPEAA